MRLKYKCTKAALLAFLFAPTAEIMAVTHVPMFCPNMIGSALLNVIAPVEHNACKIPIDADELWIAAVSIAPAISPRICLVYMVKRCINP